MDFSFSEACLTTSCTLIPRLLHIYDSGCIYHIKCPQHFLDGQAYLTTLTSILEKAIGMFHVHGHQNSCFFSYATAFIKGAEMVNGKILETLWSTLNSISPSLCTATLAHQSEVLDDHMNDGNWKKMVSMSEYLEWGWFNISLAALLFQPQKLLKITSEQWKARKIAVSTLSSSQKPPPANSWHLGRSKY